MANDFSSLFKGANGDKLFGLMNNGNLNSRTVTDIAMDDIVQNPKNAELWDTREEEIAQLAEGIKRRGFEGSVGVYRKPDGTYELYDGHMRFLAMRRLGRKVIPARVKDYPKKESEVWDDLISSNMDGRKLLLTEKAKAVLAWDSYVLHSEDPEISENAANEALAEKFHCSKDTIKRYRNIVRLSESLQALADRGVSYSALSKACVLSEAQQDSLAAAIEQEYESNGGEWPSTAKIIEMIRTIQCETASGKKAVREESQKMRKTVQNSIVKNLASVDTKLSRLKKKKDIGAEESAAMLEALRQTRKNIDSAIGFLEKK